MIPESIIEAFLDTIDIDDGLACVRAHEELLLSEAAGAELAQRIADETDAERRERLSQCLHTVRALMAHRALLFSLRQRLARVSASERSRRAEAALLAWIEHAWDWERSEAHLRAHTGEIFGRAVRNALAQHLRAYPGDSWLRLHRSLLERCRAIGIARAYAGLRSGIRVVIEDWRQSWIADAMAVFLAAENREEMRQAMAQHRDLLASEYARTFFSFLVEAARESGSAELCALMEMRLAVWQEGLRS